MNNIFLDRKNRKKIKPKYYIVSKRKAAYGILIKDAKILLVKPSWKEELDLPGGGVKQNETLIEGLIREFHEETGYKVKPITKPLASRLQLFYEDDKDKYFESTQYFFIVKIIDLDKTWKIDKKEIKKIYWINMKNIDDINLKDTYLKAIKKLSGHKSYK